MSHTSPMTQVYLVRHGEAVVNVQPIVGGMRGDKGLTERGIAQAERLRDRLAAAENLTVDVLISSTLPRARQTAEIISPGLGTHFPDNIIWDDEMQEIRVGEADGLTLEESHQRFGMFEVENDPFRPIAPGGESWSSFTLRVHSAYHRIIREHAGKTIMIVCHGGVIDGSFSYFMHLHTRIPMRLEFYPHNTSLTHWQQYNYSGTPHWRLASYNDIAHLDGIGAYESLVWSNSDHHQPPFPNEPE